MELTYKIIVSDWADEDLFNITNNLQADAKKFSEGLFKKYENLQRMPKLYQRIYYDKKSDIDYRRIVYNKYIIIYKIQKGEITILRIVSQKENYLFSKFLKSL